MIDKAVEFESRMYMFDLGNCAKEYWFKKDEGWDLCLATSDQKAAIEHKYHPTMAKKGLPEMLLPLHTLVKKKLLVENPELVQAEHSEQMSTAPEYLIAFNRNRMR